MSYKVYIKQSPIQNSYELYIVDTFRDKTSVVKPMKLVWTKIGEDEECMPTLRIPAHIAIELFKAMKAAFTKEGIKTDDENMIKAELKATKYHLQDMRKLVFKGKADR